MQKLKIEYRSIDDLKPYENNPRINDEAVDKVVKSIEKYGFKVPIIINKDNVIIAGHTRYSAAKRLNLNEIPTIQVTDLTEQQEKEFRLVDNKVSEFSYWDFDLLYDELDKLDVDLSEFGFYAQDEIRWEDVEDLNEDTYDEPKEKVYCCPSCGYETTDRKEFEKR